MLSKRFLRFGFYPFVCHNDTEGEPKMLSYLLLAAPALPGLIPMLIYVVIFVFVVALVWYLVTTFVPEPLKERAKVMRELHVMRDDLYALAGQLLVTPPKKLETHALPPKIGGQIEHILDSDQRR